jgi:cytochrome c oxidase subunit 3
MRTQKGARVSTETHPLLAHHFDTLDQQRESSTLGMWIFLVTEIMFFGGLFMAYLLYRWKFPLAFHAGSHHLDIRYGAFNTAVLICSSLTMALGVRAAQMSDRKKLTGFMVATLILGLTFLGVKAIEYHDKFVHHLIPGLHFQGKGPAAARCSSSTRCISP